MWHECCYDAGRGTQWSARGRRNEETPPAQANNEIPPLLSPLPQGFSPSRPYHATQLGCRPPPARRATVQNCGCGARGASTRWHNSACTLPQGEGVRGHNGHIMFRGIASSHPSPEPRVKVGGGHAPTWCFGYAVHQRLRPPPGKEQGKEPQPNGQEGQIQIQMQMQCQTAETGAGPGGQSALRPDWWGDLARK